MPAFTVSRTLNKILFVGRLNAEALAFLLEEMGNVEGAGFEDAVLDFSKCDQAYTNGTVPLAALAASWKARGFEFGLTLPESLPIARLFENTGLARFIDPDQFEATGFQSAKHVPIQRFLSHQDQVALVFSFMDIILKSTSLSRDVLQGLEWSLNEVMDNVPNHANAPLGGFASLTTLNDRVSFTVADCGIGVLASLKEGHPHLSNDTEALGEAIKGGVTRNKEAGQGNGLAGTLSIATASGGSFSIWSGRGRLNVFHDPKSSQLDSRRIVLNPWQAFPGTIVDAQILKSPTFKVSDALGFTGMIGGVYDLIEARYESQTGAEFMIKLANETTGCGNRTAGRQIRTKCLNLLEADRSLPLVLDWTGVPVISSSFADEAIGKLFVELGPLSFSSRVKNIGMEPLVRGLIEKAILQRASEASQRFTTRSNGIEKPNGTTGNQESE